MIALKRNYKMSDGKNVETSQRVLVGANRDVMLLTPYGYDGPRLVLIEGKITTFASQPTDVELSSMMMEATAAKNNKRKEAADYIMIEVMLRVENTYGLTSPTYRRFGVTDIYNESDGNFYLLLLRVFRQASALAPTLTGLSAVILQRVADFETEFKTVWVGQDVAIDNRDQAVQTRVELGNDLYKDIADIADIGKRLWLNKDESKYNDYVLYPKGEPAAQQVVESDVNAGTVVNLSVTALTAESRTEYHNDGQNTLKIYYSNAPAQYPTGAETVIVIEPGTDWKGKASEGGYQAGVREYLNVYNEGPNAGHIVVTIPE